MNTIFKKLVLFGFYIYIIIVKDETTNINIEVIAFKLHPQSNDITYNVAIPLFYSWGIIILEFF